MYDKIREECLYFFDSHIGWMALVVKEDVALYPIGIVLFRRARISFKTDLAAELV